MSVIRTEDHYSPVQHVKKSTGFTDLVSNLDYRRVIREVNNNFYFIRIERSLFFEREK